LGQDSEYPLPPPDKNIPASVMIIGSFEIGMALLGLVILILAGNFEGTTIAFLVLLLIYGAMGAGLLAIQEWARRANVILHIIAIPYAFYTAFFLSGPSDWRLLAQILISVAIVLALTRPTIRHKFQTAGPKRTQA
jgi:uncharacterized membrane protein (DUF2068 family)